MNIKIKHAVNRRIFLKKFGITIFLLPLSQTTIFSKSSYADTLEPVDESGPMAVSLDYVHDATSSTVRNDSSAICKNCRLYVDQDNEWGGCSIFPSNTVNANGWCKAWVAK
jgi:hypothetical protein